MAFELRKIEAPTQISPDARELMAQADEAGFVELGWLEFSEASVIPLVGYALPDGTATLSVLGQRVDGVFEPLSVDCVSELDEGRKLTTTTGPWIMPQPDRGIYKFSHPGLSVGDLYARHLEHVDELEGTAQPRATTLEELLSAITDYLDQEGFFQDAEEPEDPGPTLIGRSGDFTLVTGPIRPDARPVHLYNEGLMVFLYDESREDAIRDADPKVVWWVGREILEDRATLDLLESRDLLLYAQPGDGGVDAEIVVGPDLRPEEMAPGIWDPPQSGWLRLPTGRLCVHSYNTLPMGDNGDEPLDEGAVVEVPPGTYRVTLRRKDWWRMEEEGVVDLEEAEEAGIDVFDGQRVDEVIVLTPLPEDREPPEGLNFLFKECVGL